MASVHLSSALKALIASPQAQGGVVPAPSKAAATALFEGLASSAQQHGLGAPAWLTLGVRTNHMALGFFLTLTSGFSRWSRAQRW